MTPLWLVTVRKGGMRVNPQPFRKERGMHLMKLSSFEQDIENQFDCLSKKVINAVVKTYHRDMRRRSKHETPFSDFSDLEISIIGVFDTYGHEHTAFDVLGEEVSVFDDKLVEALKSLPEKKLDIIMMFYFMDMPDAEIAEVLNLNRSTVYRHRIKTLKKIKEMMED